MITKKTQANSDGLIKCLPQPGTTSQSILKSMPVNSVPFIKHCDTRTVFSPGTASSGCGPTRMCLVLCSSPRLFHRDTKLHCHLSGLGTVSQFHRDPWLRCHLPGLAKNKAPRHRRHLIKPPGRYQQVSLY
jgi:hypothetical protein